MEGTIDYQPRRESLAELKEKLKEVNRNISYWLYRKREGYDKYNCNTYLFNLRYQKSQLQNKIKNYGQVQSPTH